MYDEMLAKQQAETAYMAGNALSNHRPTRRQALERQREGLQKALANVDAALAALDKHTELEEFIETLQRANV